MDFDDCSCSGKTLGRLVQPAVMALLSEESLHGYLIVQRLGQMAMFKSYPPDPTGVYRLLRSMEDDGLVRSNWDVGDAGPAKRRFELTDNGRACFEQWTQTLQEYSECLGELMTTIRRIKGNRRHKSHAPSGRVESQEEVAAALPPDRPSGAWSQGQPPRRMRGTLPTFSVDGMTLDSLDLKVLLLTGGMFVEEEVYRAFGSTRRISPDPLECSVLFLPDRTVVHIANVGPDAPFHLALGADRSLQILHRGQFVTEAALPRASAFYRQTTSRGVPFRGLGVLQGHDVLAFPYLWPCEFAKAGQACHFCHCGNYTQQQMAAGIQQEVVFTPQDVADAVHYAVNIERSAKYIQLTGGSTHRTDGECGQIVQTLRAIDEVAGLASIPGEIIVYTTPPKDTKEIDKLFAAGADRIACDMEVWDEELARRICPGKYQWTGRQRHLDMLLHIARTQGPCKACSTFVVGLEPAESFLAGAEYLASNGIVPIPSIWMPHGLPAIPQAVKADLGFFRQVRKGLAAIYDKHRCQPPGDIGFNVCLCRDTWNYRAEIIAGC